MDLGHEAAGAQDAAEGDGSGRRRSSRYRDAAGLARHPDGAVLVCGREGRAEGGQLGEGAELSGLVPIPVPLRVPNREAACDQPKSFVERGANDRFADNRAFALGDVGLVCKSRSVAIQRDDRMADPSPLLHILFWTGY